MSSNGCACHYIALHGLTPCGIIIQCFRCITSTYRDSVVCTLFLKLRPINGLRYATFCQVQYMQSHLTHTAMHYITTTHNKTRHISIHCSATQRATQHHILQRLLYTTLHDITLGYTIWHRICSSECCTTTHYLDHPTLQYTKLHGTATHYIVTTSLRFFTATGIVLHFITLHCNELDYITYRNSIKQNKAQHRTTHHTVADLKPPRPGSRGCVKLRAGNLSASDSFETQPSVSDNNCPMRAPAIERMVHTRTHTCT